MDRKERRMIIVCIVVLVLLVINFLTAVETFVGYNMSKKSGNERWKQVEERIVRMEMDVDNLKMEVGEWKI